VSQNDITLGVRPEHISISDAGNGLRGEIFSVEYLGARQLITVDTGAGRLKVRAPNTVKAAYGDHVGLAFRSDHLVLFDNQTDRALASDLINGGVYGASVPGGSARG
jgi:multiple sugar transport system ATP-binding protein